MSAWRRALAALGAATVLAAASLTSATAQPDFAGTMLGSPMPLEVDAGVTARLALFPTGAIAPDEPLAATVVVDNRTAANLDGAAVTMRVSRSPLRTAEAVSAFVDSPSGGLREVARDDVGSPVEVDPPEDAEPTPDEEPTMIARLAPGESTSIRVEASPEDLGLPSDRWGVYGIDLVLTTPDGARRIDSGVITWTGAGVPELAVATLVTAEGQPSRTAAALTATEGLPGIAYAVDPTTLTDEDGTTAALPAEDVFLLPAFHPDLASLAHGDDALLLPYAIDRSRREAPAAAAAADGVEDDAVDDSEDDSGGAAAELPWLAVTPSVDSATATLARDQGAAALALALDPELEGDTLPATDAPVTPAVATAAIDGDEVAVLLPEPSLSSAIADADQSDPTAAGTAVALAALVAGRAEDPVLISPGASWSAPVDGPSRALRAVLDAPFVTPRSVEGLLLEDAPRSLSLPVSEATEADAAPEQIAALGEAFTRLEELAATAADPFDVIDPTGTALVASVATDLRDRTEVRDLRIGGAIDAVEVARDALGVAAGSDVNLIAAKGAVPVSVRNLLDVDATVAVDMVSLSPNLRILDAPTATIPAGATQTVLVEVEAVSTADVDARIVLRNPDGVILGEAVTLNVRVRADWGNALTAAFTAGLVLLLVAGVWRTVRRGRKDTRTGPRTGSEAANTGDNGSHD